jgi:hypothetical protein
MSKRTDITSSGDDSDDDLPPLIAPTPNVQGSTATITNAKKPPASSSTVGDEVGGVIPPKKSTIPKPGGLMAQTVVPNGTTETKPTSVKALPSTATNSSMPAKAKPQHSYAVTNAEDSDDDELPPLLQAPSAGNALRPAGTSSIITVKNAEALRMCLSLLGDSAFRPGNDGIEVSCNDKDWPEFGQVLFPVTLVKGVDAKLGGFSIPKARVVALVNWIRQQQYLNPTTDITLGLKQSSISFGKNNVVDVKPLQSPGRAPHPAIQKATSAGQLKMGTVHLCNVLSHLSQFGSAVDVAIENLSLTLTVAGTSIALSGASVNERHGSARSIPLLRFIDVLRYALLLSIADCTVSCGTEIPGMVVQFAGPVNASFYMKETKKKA